MIKKSILYKWFTFVAIAVFALSLAACGSSTNTGSTGNEESEDVDVNEDSEAASKGETVRIGYQKGNTLNILKESGFLEEALEDDGYKVEWTEFARGGALMEGLFTGNIDLGHAADGPGIFAQAGNKPFVYIGADLPNREGVGIVAHEDSGIKTAEDLKGKKIGAMNGGNHHYLAILAIQDAGLSVDDVEWVIMQEAAQLRTAFETKQIDALATYDPFFASIEIDLDVVDVTEGKSYDYPNRTFYYANEDFNEQHPELVDIFLEALDRSDQWANENKDEVVELVSEMLGIDEEVIARATERREYAVEKINDEIIAAQQKQADIYYEVGLIPAEIDVTERMQ